MACFKTRTELSAFVVGATQGAFPDTPGVSERTTFGQLGLQHPAIEVYCLGMINLVKAKGCPVTIDASDLAAKAQSLKDVIDILAQDLRLPP